MSNSHSGTIGRTRGLSMSGQVRRQRSIEWQKERRYSSSDDDTGGPLRNNAAPSIDSSILASIIKQTQQLTNADRSYRSDCETEDGTIGGGAAAAFGIGANSTNPAMTNRSPMHMRQASPFPLESTNRRLHYAAKAEERIRNGDSIFTAGKPAILANNTLIRTSRGLTNRRHGASNNLTSSSSTISSVSNNNNDRDKECKELIKDKEKEIYDNPHHRFGINSDGDDEPPPEPAPPEVPPRGHSSSSSTMLAGATMKKRPDFVLTIDKNGDQKHEEYIPSTQQDLLMGGSHYPTRSSPMVNGISNQRYFGGNPKKITVMGHGSGASASNYLAMSQFPQARSSLNGVISMSGTALSEHMIDETPTQSTEQIAVANNCSRGNETEFLKCMRERDVEEIVKGDSKVEVERLGEGMVKAMTGMAGFSPAVESPDDQRALPGFLTASPRTSMEEGKFNRVPILAGVTKDETGSFFTEKVASDVLKDPLKFLKDVQSQLKLRNLVDLGKQVGSGLLERFSGLKPTEVLGKVVESSTDALFNLPLFMALSEWSKFAPAYLYSFEYGGKSGGKHFLGGLPIGANKSSGFVSHGDELGYLFHVYDVHGNQISDTKMVSKDDRRVRSQFAALIAKFAHMEANSTGSDGLFRAFSAKGASFIRITDEIKVENDFRFCEMKMWGAPIESLQQVSCSALGKAVGLVSKLALG